MAEMEEVGWGCYRSSLFEEKKFIHNYFKGKKQDSEEGNYDPVLHTVNLALFTSCWPNQTPSL